MKLILIGAKAQHGKDSVAEILKQKLKGKVLVVHYADYLKFIAKEYFNWDGKKDEKGRQLLQWLGTDIIRKRNPNFHMEVICKLIDVFKDAYDYIIIPDTRFKNEIDVPRQLYDKGEDTVYAVWVTRLNFENSLTEEQRNHPSENDLNDYGFDYYLSSESGLDKLSEQVDKFIEWLGEN